MWDYFYCILISSDVAPRETSDRVIESRASAITYSDGVRGDILLHVDSIEQRLISVVYLKVIMVEINHTRWTPGFIAIV